MNYKAKENARRLNDMLDRIENNKKKESLLLKYSGEMLETLMEVQNLINGSDFHDEQKRSKVWSQVDSIINKMKGE